jgi:hypothetical protein
VGKLSLFLRSLFLSAFSFSVEFENSFGKVLIFVAGFGSTLFPFIFVLAIHVTAEKWW